LQAGGYRRLAVDHADPGRDETTGTRGRRCAAGCIFPTTCGETCQGEDAKKKVAETRACSASEICHGSPPRLSQIHFARAATFTLTPQNDLNAAMASISRQTPLFAGNPAISSAVLRLETGGFASPPYGGFALA
jgi:hypothetical protein